MWRSQHLLFCSFILSFIHSFVLCYVWERQNPIFLIGGHLMIVTLKYCCSKITSLLLHCRSDYSLAKYWHGLFYLMLVSRPKSPSIY